MDRFLRVAREPIVENGILDIDLPMGPASKPVKFYLLFFYLKYTVATANAENPSDMGVLAIVNEMQHDVMFVNREPERPKLLSGRNWYERNRHLHFIEPPHNTPPLGQAANIVYGCLMIPYAQPNPVRLARPCLMSPQLEENKLTIRFGAVDGSIVDAGAGGTVVFTEGHVTISAMVDWDEFDPREPHPVYYERFTNRLVTAIGEEVRLTLPRGYAYSDYILWTKDDSAYNNALIEDFEWLLAGRAIYQSHFLQDWYGFMNHQGVYDRRVLVGVAGTEVPYAYPTGILSKFWDIEGDLNDQIDSLRKGQLKLVTPVAVAPTGVAEVGVAWGGYRQVTSAEASA